MASDEDIQMFISSGIIEMVAMDMAEDSEKELLNKMAAEHLIVRKAIDDFSDNLEQYVRARSVQPSLNIKPLVMAVVDYQDRMVKDEIIETPPVLHPGSLPSDYAPWLQSFTEPELTPDDTIYARIFDMSETNTIGVVWIKDQTDPEIHEHELESFLILEGTCDIMVADKKYQLAAGDYFEIPLFRSHQLTVTSAIPCKAILQRRAA